jgi:hypothetical protein
LAAAEAMGKAMLERGIGLVYGGASVGLMGRIADTVLAGGGEAIGVIPQALVDLEVAHDGLTEQHVVASMHERKAMMAELSDGFVAMPGGIGTFEEIFEILTWAQLGFHQKPCALLNVERYYDGLVAFMDHACEQGFFRQKTRDMLLQASGPKELLDKMARYQPEQRKQWLHTGEV